MRCRKESLGGFLAIMVLASSTSGLEIINVSTNASSVGLYELFEVQFDLDTDYTNEFDPDEIDVTMTFTGPSSTVREIPCYWTDQSPAWRARIAPLELGAHTCVITAEDDQSQSDTHTVNFTGVSSTSKGYVGLDSRNPYYMIFSDGTPYIPMGHNLCWQFRDANYDDYLNNMGAHGENWSRLWAGDFGQGLEWGHNEEPQYAGLGTYSQNNAEQLEWMLDVAKTNGVYYQICFDSFTAWNHDTFASWDINPFNNDNGGPLGAPIGVFTDATTKEYFKKRYRYYVARYAWHPNVLAWEFWNEADAIGSGGPWSQTYHTNRQVAADWHEEMGAYIKSIDPYDHLITTSYVYPFQDQDLYPEIWNLPEMDVVNLHQYDINVPVSHVDMIVAARQFNKPSIFGEGNQFANSGDQESLDPGGITVHNQNWAGVVSEGGTVMSWWWGGYIHDNNLYYRWDGVVGFTQGEDWAPLDFDPVTVTKLTGPSNMTFYGSATNDHAIVWVHNQSGGQVYNLSFDLPQVTVNSVEAEWWNTGNGTVIQTDTVTRQNGILTFSSPPVANDIALKVKPSVPQPTIGLSVATLTPSAEEGNNASAESFTIQNTGSVTLNYTLSDDASWLSLSPTSGSSTGEADTINVTYATSGLSAGTYYATITATDSAATNNPQTIAVTLTITPVGGIALTNGDFSNGLTGWTQWTERGSISFANNAGRGHVSGNNINGGLWQQFSTGGTGTPIDITGWWESNPTTANNQWAEVLVINGSRTPVNGQDVNDGQSDVVMIYKNDTWATPGGWSGSMDQTAPVANVGTFTADGSVATIILKVGNAGGSTNGALFDNLSLVAGTPQSPTIALNTSSLSPSTDEGSSPANDTFTVSNSGGGTLSYSVSDDQSWMSVSPTTGTSTGEADTITVSYSAGALAPGTYNGTITVSDSAATNNPQTIAVALTVNALPATITLNTSSLSPSTDEGSSPANDTFTVQNTGGSTPLYYMVADDASWLSVSPATGDSTGEADTITVSYATGSLSAGTHNATITVSDPNATNNPQTIAVTLTVNATGGTTVAEDFETMPSWSSSYDAGWGSAANWYIVSGGQSGDALEVSRGSQGSSAKVKTYTIDANTDYTISVYIRCPSFGGVYWAECAYKLGSHTASDFDNNGGSWTMIKKFDSGANGNGDVWTQYSLNFNSGSNTQISVGHKLGSSGGGGPAVRWDTLRIE